MSSGNTQKDGSGDSYWLLQDAVGRLIVGSQFTTALQLDSTADDSDKTFTVPAGYEWIIKTIHVTYLSTGTAGNRQIAIRYLDDAANIIYMQRAGAVQAAGLTRYYQFAPFVSDLTSFRDTDYLSTPIPNDLVLPAGYQVRVYDKAAIAAAADDMTVAMVVLSRPTV